MPFYEQVWETGEVSVGEYVDDATCLAAVTAQNDKAKVGGLNGPQGGPATRIASVYKYPVHPGSLNEAGGLSADVLQSGLAELLANMTDMNGVVNVMAFAEAVTQLVHPMQAPASPHDSRFKMESIETLDLSDVI